MTTSRPQIQKFMSASPHSIGAEQSIAHAEEQLKKYGVRHLPVLTAGALVGIVTQRDLAVIESVKGVDRKTVLVSDIMNIDVYQVGPDALLSEVAAVMAEKKYGSAVVMKADHAIGIFTTVDACRALCELLKNPAT